MMTASPISGWWSVHDVGDVAEAQRRAVVCVASIGTLARSSGVDDRRDVPDAEPLVGRLDEAAGADHGAVGELQQPGVERVGGGLHDLVERHLVRRACVPGRPAPACILSRSPQMATLATPGTRSRRARIFQ